LSKTSLWAKPPIKAFLDARFLDIRILSKIFQRK